ncbi:hypothetical protein [Bacillus thuringiensis]|uniref:hypothetical protein n=1 Tax=Bacillus thuringiensis TaxID=1428 RepID=UPI001C3FF2EB|nr:hypothetical protein [Bacillus thuringiensis]
MNNNSIRFHFELNANNSTKNNEETTSNSLRFNYNSQTKSITTTIKEEREQTTSQTSH